MLITDRDLLVLEPNLFRDVQFAACRLLSGVGSITGAVLTVLGANWTDRTIEEGCIILFDSTPLEVLSTIDSDSVAISVLRADSKATAIAPVPAASRPVLALSFRPQIDLVHRQLVRALELNPEGDDVFPLDETAITDARALADVEALGALACIYGAASSLSGSDSPFGQRAEHYRKRFTEDRDKLAVPVDTDGDGEPDATRRFNHTRQNRA